MGKLIWFLFAAALIAGDSSAAEPTGWPLRPPVEGAMPVVTAQTLRGIYPVGSHVADNKALGGFGPCENYPFDLSGQNWGKPGAVSLVAFPDERVAYYQHQGIALRVVNRTSDNASFAACDSRLSIFCEARDGQGVWRAVESWLKSDCGHSFHRVTLKPSQYWQIPARVYSGPTKTKLRYRLDREEEPAIYSNEFDGAINVEQFVSDKRVR